VIWAGEEALELLRAILVHLLVPEILIALLRVKLDHQRLAEQLTTGKESAATRSTVLLARTHVLADYPAEDHTIRLEPRPRIKHILKSQT
jgi:hypothetical protein